MKTYKTLLTKDYIPSWIVANGIREWVANALDSHRLLVLTRS